MGYKTIHILFDRKLKEKNNARFLSERVIGVVLKISLRNPTYIIHFEVFTTKDLILNWFILISVLYLNWAF